MELNISDIAFACGSGGSAAGMGVGAYLYSKHNTDSSLKFLTEGKPPGKPFYSLLYCIYVESIIFKLVHAYIVCDNPKYFYDHIDHKILPEMGLPEGSGVSSENFLQIW